MRHCRLSAAALPSLCSALRSPLRGRRSVPSRARSSNCSPARAARPVPPPTSCWANSRKDPSIVAMSLPVDYWDYLGWKDTLALPGHAKRQRAYAGARGDREVYTPQVVVNGATHVLGSDKAAIERAIAASAPQRRSAVAAGDGCGRRRQAHGRRAGRQGRARQRRGLAVPDRARRCRSQIARGENRGRTVTYHNVVRRWIKLGDWKGKAQTLQRAAGRDHGERRASMRSRCWCRAAQPRRARQHARRRASRVAAELSHDSRNFVASRAKKGPAGAGPKRWGLNRTRNTTGPVRSSPGGLGG